MSQRRTARRRRLVPAVALATLVHLLAFLALGWRIPTVAEKREDDLGPPVQITLVRPPQPARPPAPAARPAPLREPYAAPPAPSPSPLPPVLTQPAPAPGAPQPDAAPDGEHFRSALRGLLGCNDPAAFRLNREERTICDQRLAAAKPAPVGPEYSAEELAQFNADKKESIFTRKLHNQCLPRIGDRPAGVAGVGGRNGSTTTLGIGCAWSF